MVIVQKNMFDNEIQAAYNSMMKEKEGLENT